MKNKLSEIEKKVFENFKIVEVSAEDCSHGFLYILAPNVKTAEEKARLMTYKGVKGREVEVSEEMQKMRYYDDAIKWASKNDLRGDPIYDTFWFNSFREEEAE